MRDPYAVIARFYDRAVGDGGDDLALYAALAMRSAGPILELGCGTGRVSLSLAGAGHRVVGVDQSAAMLAIAQRRAFAAGVRIDYVRGAIEQPPLHARFGLIVCALDSWLHLTSLTQQRHSLSAARTLLRPDGVLVLDLPTLASWSDWQPGVRPVELLWRDHDPITDSTTLHFTSFRADPARQRRVVTHIFDEHHQDGSVRRWSAEYDLRFVGRYELLALLREAGLHATGIYGDYELGPLTESSERMIVTAERTGKARRACG